MLEKPGFSVAAQQPVEGKTGATADFPYDRLTVERFRSAFPGARWRDDLRAWFVPGTTAERRLNRWLGREMSGVLAYADDQGRDAFAFQPVESRYLEVAAFHGQEGECVSPPDIRIGEHARHLASEPAIEPPFRCRSGNEPCP